jgi:hypothetical protein
VCIVVGEPKRRLPDCGDFEIDRGAMEDGYLSINSRRIDRVGVLTEKLGDSTGKLETLS